MDAVDISGCEAIWKVARLERRERGDMMTLGRRVSQRPVRVSGFEERCLVHLNSFEPGRNLRDWEFESKSII